MPGDGCKNVVTVSFEIGRKGKKLERPPKCPSTVHWINTVLYSYNGIPQKSNWTTATDVSMDESQWSKQVTEEYIHSGSISVEVKTRLLIKYMVNERKARKWLTRNALLCRGGQEGNETEEKPSEELVVMRYCSSWVGGFFLNCMFMCFCMYDIFNKIESKKRERFRCR